MARLETQELDLPLPQDLTNQDLTDGVSSGNTGRKLKKSDELLRSEDIGENNFQWQSEAAQSTVDDEKRVVSSGLLMNNVNPEERIVIVGYLDNEEIAEEQEEQEQEQEIEVAESHSEPVWIFYTEAGP